MRQLFYIAIICAIGLLIGGWTASYSLKRVYGVNTIQIGGWTARPFAGSKSVDPYTRARASSNGTLPIGLVEGLTFETLNDENGLPLTLNCSYEVFGNAPPARLWTLAAYDTQNEIIVSVHGENAALLSSQIVRFQDYSFSINIASSPTAGNWMQVDGSGPFKLIMRVYDTPIAANAGSIQPNMPSVKRKRCQ